MSVFIRIQEMNLLITGSASDNVYHIAMSLDGVARRGLPSLEKERQRDRERGGGELTQLSQLLLSTG